MKKKAEAKKKVPKAPKLFQPLASLPPTSPVKPDKKAVSSKAKEDDIDPHYFDFIFLMEQLGKFSENPFDGDIRALPIPACVVDDAEKLIEKLKNICADLNAIITERDEVDA
jgi:hypothetical protein